MPNHGTFLGAARLPIIFFFSKKKSFLWRR